MNVASMMSTPVYTAHRDTLIADVVRTMMERRISVVPVVDDQRRVVGVISVADLVPQARNAPASNITLMSLQDEYVDVSSLEEAYEEVAQLPAWEVMHELPVTIRPEEELGTAARLMIEHRVGALPVVGADGALVGIVTRTDLARLTIDRGHP
ncbi:MAG TPA: CBS domain-containing protein [Thermoanaerobaculia bacterium]|nr:CBS domain-containing protein [Thermoanaerobaculia bacterium]